MQILQLQKVVGNAQVQRMINENAHAIQLRPQKNPENENEYIDPDFPLLKMTKPGRPTNKYVIINEGTEIYYEAGEGYYSDYGCTSKLDMSKYLGNPNEREGIANNNGESYYYRINSHSGGFVGSMRALGLARELNTEKEQDFDQGKVNSIVQEIREKRTIYPIEITMRDGLPRLVQGRHRIAASALCGLQSIPYNNV